MSNLKQYVLVHVRSIDLWTPLERVLLIHKKRPAFQAGRLNLCGGKIEPGETPLQAAVRELKEETGLEPHDGTELLCGSLMGVESIIHCVRVDVYKPTTTYHKTRHLQSGDPVLSPRQEEDEEVKWFSFSQALKDERLMPNLQVIIPLMHFGATEWQIFDQNSSSVMHDIQLLLPIKKPFING